MSKESMTFLKTHHSRFMALDLENFVLSQVENFENSTNFQPLYVCIEDNNVFLFFDIDSIKYYVKEVDINTNVVNFSRTNFNIDIQGSIIDNKIVFKSKNFNKFLSARKDVSQKSFSFANDKQKWEEYEVL